MKLTCNRCIYIFKPFIGPLIKEWIKLSAEINLPNIN